MALKEFPELEATPNWQAQAACRGMDTEMFFPERGETKLFARVRKICDSCDVVVQCFQHAVKNDEDFGIWGGTNGKARRPRFQERSLMLIKQRQAAFRGEIVEVSLQRPKKRW